MANELIPTWKLEGLSVTGMRDGGKTSSLPAAQACRIWPCRQPGGLRWGSRWKSSHVPPSRSLLSGCHGVRSGRKCLLNQCVRWWGEVRPGGLSTPGICAQIPDGISSAQSMPGPWASPHPRPGQGRRGAASVLGPEDVTTVWSALEVGGWLAKLSVTSQLPLPGSVPIPSSFILLASLPIWWEASLPLAGLDLVLSAPPPSWTSCPGSG